MKQLLFAFMLLAVIKSNGQEKKDTLSILQSHSSIIPAIGSGYSTMVDAFTGKYFTGTVNARSFINLQDSTYQYYPIIFSSSSKTSAYLKSGSDTLEVFDSVIELYGSKIRYIKTMNGSIIKL